MKKVFSEVIALLYVCLLLYTAIAKLMDYDITREQMGMMPLIAPISQIVTWLLPSFEILIAILLFIPQYRMIGLYLVNSLMISFTVYVTYMMVYYEELPCSCGGFLEQLSWPEHILFNCTFILLGILAIVFSTEKQTNKVKQRIISTNKIL